MSDGNCVRLFGIVEGAIRCVYLSRTRTVLLIARGDVWGISGRRFVFSYISVPGEKSIRGVKYLVLSAGFIEVDSIRKTAKTLESPFWSDEGVNNSHFSQKVGRIMIVSSPESLGNIMIE